MGDTRRQSLFMEYIRENFSVRIVSVTFSGGVCIVVTETSAVFLLHETLEGTITEDNEQMA